MNIMKRKPRAKPPRTVKRTYAITFSPLRYRIGGLAAVITSDVRD